MDFIRVWKQWSVVLTDTDFYNELSSGYVQNGTMFSADCLCQDSCVGLTRMACKCESRHTSVIWQSGPILSDILKSVTFLR